MAFVALIQLAAFQLTVARGATFGANKPLRPAQAKQGLTARLPGAILIHELMQSQAFLELHRILWHRDTLIFSNRPIIPALAAE